jgi:hypothetical protein
LRCHELHLVAIRAEASRPVMHAATSFYPDEHRGQLGNKGYQVVPGQALAKHDLAPFIHPYCVKQALAMSIPRTLISCFIGLVSCGDMVLSDSEIIVAHRSRSAQGRVHFITTTRCENCWIHTTCLTTHTPFVIGEGICGWKVLLRLRAKEWMPMAHARSAMRFLSTPQLLNRV